MYTNVFSICMYLHMCMLYTLCICICICIYIYICVYIYIYIPHMYRLEGTCLPIAGVFSQGSLTEVFQQLVSRSWGS